MLVLWLYNIYLLLYSQIQRHTHAENKAPKNDHFLLCRQHGQPDTATGFSHNTIVRFSYLSFFLPFTIQILIHNPFTIYSLSKTLCEFVTS